MSIGEGIFFGSLFLGIIYLFLQTRDRWNWKKISLISLSILCGIVLIILGLIFKSEFTSSVKSFKPEVQSSLIGISLDDKFSDVQFRIQSTKSKNQGSSKAEIWYTLSDNINHLYAIDSDSKKVVVITVGCSDDSYRYPNLYGALIHQVKCGDTSEILQMTYGKEKARVSCYVDAKDKFDSQIDYTSRVYDFIKFGTRFHLQHNKVVAVQLMSPERLDNRLGSSWKNCD
jgi:hypothetical protein